MAFITSVPTQLSGTRTLDAQARDMLDHRVEAAPDKIGGMTLLDLPDEDAAMKMEGVWTPGRTPTARP